MPTVLYSPASPYSAKVRMAARAAGIELEGRLVNAEEKPAELLAANPLGKIPVLLTDDGASIYDSRAITQYLNRTAGGTLFPRNAAKRTEAEMLEALADGICDCLLAQVYERRLRPAEMVYQPWIDRQWTKVAAALDHLNASPPKLTKRPHCGQIALRAAIGYLELRFADSKWQRGRGKLARWAKRFDERFPELAELVSRA